MLEPVMTLREGASIYRPGGALLQTGDLLRQPGLADALTVISVEGAATAYTGTVASSLLALSEARGGSLTRDDLTAYRAEWSAPVEVRFASRRLLTRGGLSGLPETLVRFDPAGGPAALLTALDPAGDGGHTTNLSVADAEGNTCVVTSSLGLGSGDWLPGFDLHLNSMLGEADLIRAPLEPGSRMESMMAPTIVLGLDGCDLAAGAAGGTRLRTALVGVLGAVLWEGLEPQVAVDRPRFHPVGELVNAEPGVDEAWLASLERDGRPVRRWSTRHHYFGGVSTVGLLGSAADPRRSGAVGYA
jgi:gamma-glutamyltranspeptidase/glutathione hydrolase